MWFFGVGEGVIGVFRLFLLCFGLDFKLFDRFKFWFYYWGIFMWCLFMVKFKGLFVIKLMGDWLLESFVWEKRFLIVKLFELYLEEGGFMVIIGVEL